MFNCDFRELLTVAVLLLIVLAALLVEDDHLVALYERSLYLGNYLSALHGGGAYGDCTFVVNKKYVLELYFLSGLSTCKVVNEEGLVSLNLELLALNLNNSVHVCFIVFYDASTGGESRRETA